MKKATKQMIVSIGAVIFVILFGAIIMMGALCIDLTKKLEKKVQAWVDKK